MEVRKCLIIGRSIWPTVRHLAITAAPGVVYILYHSKFRCPQVNKNNPPMPMKCLEVWRDGAEVFCKRNDGSTTRATC